MKGSYHMEKEGLIRSLKMLKQKKFKVGTLVTDRHKQIAKWLRENAKTTTHKYDIWHLAKCKNHVSLAIALFLHNRQHLERR